MNLEEIKKQWDYQKMMGTLIPLISNQCLFCTLELTEMQKVDLCLYISKTYGKYWNERLKKWCDITSFDKE